MLMLLIQVAIMAVFVIYGLKIGGAMGVGIFSMLALAVMIFVFGLPAGGIPWTAIIIILAIGIAGGLLEASGGLDWLVYYAGRLIQAKPAAITFVAPLVIFFFVFGVGTANIALALEPVIARTALRARVRPERPLVAAVTAANMGLLASPAASSALTAIAILGGHDFSIGQYMAVVLPSGLIATVALSLFMCFRGKKLEDEPKFQELLASGELNDGTSDEKKPEFTRQQVASVSVFMGAIACILTLGLCEPLLQAITTPLANGKYIPPAQLVILFMFVAAGAILIATRISANTVFKTRIFTAAISAAVAVLGPGWLGNTIFMAPENAAALKEGLGDIITAWPWIVVIVCGLVATFVMSQTAIITIVYPLALGLGVPPAFMAAMVQAVNVNYFIPAQPTLLFAEEIDTTGTTRKYRFWLPGVVSLSVSVVVGVIITGFI
ncbi:anaerobic C4-dicarboxylate transporter family protein [Cedecea colo]|uniref:Anaerobic C4-dicarboxylate transporter n=1 Tax=Cedecea colo TaxID=2552946 RepID=A0ABX0VLB8_9ENTR|nr:anaerobic C4-dicarboxylate transporter family protein [Cedecea colo]NIY47854.1 anaerobic C4-dicarboxylate transporter [Cedecea colo]